MSFFIGAAIYFLVYRQFVIIINLFLIYRKIILFNFGFFPNLIYIIVFCLFSYNFGYKYLIFLLTLNEFIYYLLVSYSIPTLHYFLLPFPSYSIILIFYYHLIFKSFMFFKTNPGLSYTITQIF